jgi:hypothetical protein
MKIKILTLIIKIKESAKWNSKLEAAMGSCSKEAHG